MSHSTERKSHVRHGTKFCCANLLCNKDYLSGLASCPTFDELHNLFSG